MPAMPVKRIAEPTLTASALSRIRSDIIACRLMPDERLRFEALRERYGMGVSPLREALMRLEAEGLVQLEQNKGFRVSEVSRENLLDLMQTRIEIEFDRASVVAGKRRRRVGGQSARGIPSAVPPNQDRSKQSGNYQRGMEPRARSVSYRSRFSVRFADSDIDP